MNITKPKMTFGDTLRFSPYVWAKILWMRDRGNTEVAGYGITGTEDSLLVTDFKLIKSHCTGASFDMDPDDIAEFMETMLDQGLPPWAFMNLLFHTHPGNCANPSPKDEDNFVKAFSHPDWAIMFIVANGGDTYCRLKVNVGPGIVRILKVKVDFSQEFRASNHTEWEKEYKDKVVVKKFSMTPNEGMSFPDQCNEEYNLWETLEEIDKQIEEAGGGVDEIDYEITECRWNGDGEVEFWEEANDVWYYYDPIKNQWRMGDWADDDSLVKEIEPPNEPWVAKVVDWANQFANERMLAMEDN